MDYGKHKYQEAQKQKDARKRQNQIVVKEIKMRPKISDNDYRTKRGHVERFLNDGAKVKATIMFRGREMSHTEFGKRLLDRLAEDLSELATVESHPLVDGRNMIMVLAPSKAAIRRREAELAAASPDADGLTPLTADDLLGDVTSIEDVTDDTTDDEDDDETDADDDSDVNRATSAAEVAT